MSNYKLARVGGGSVLADFDTKVVKTFNSSGRFVSNGFSGTPKFSECYVISLVQVGAGACLYDGVSEKEVASAPKVLATLMKSPFSVYPLQVDGVSPKGIRYKQYIFCYSSKESHSTALASL